MEKLCDSGFGPALFLPRRNQAIAQNDVTGSTYIISSIFDNAGLFSRVIVLILGNQTWVVPDVRGYPVLAVKYLLSQKL